MMRLFEEMVMVGFQRFRVDIGGAIYEVAPLTMKQLHGIRARAMGYSDAHRISFDEAFLALMLREGLCTPEPAEPMIQHYGLLPIRQEEEKEPVI